MIRNVHITEHTKTEYTDCVYKQSGGERWWSYIPFLLYSPVLLYSPLYSILYSPVLLYLHHALAHILPCTPVL